MARTTTDEKAGRKVFRVPRSAWVVTAGAFVVVLAFTAIAFAVGMSWWYRAGFVAFSGLFVVAFVELAVEHVTLDGDEIRFVRGFKRRAMRRREIAGVTWEKGAGVSIRLHEGGWQRLPPVGGTSQGVTNSIRAWLAREQEEAREDRDA
jgi:hypothetical protein